MSGVEIIPREGTRRWSINVPDLIPTMAILAVVALLAVLFGSVLADMAHDWWIEPAWSQGMLLPPLAVYIAWLRRPQILQLAGKPESTGMLLTALGCFVFVIGRLASEFFLARISFVIVLAGLIWTFWGRRRLNALGFPLLLLATMVPLPVMFYNSAAAPLQLFASDAATRIVQALGVTVFRDGNIIQLAGMSLGVAEACSGLNSLSALFVGSMVLGFVWCTSLKSRLILVGVSVPLAIAINVLRVAGTAILADHNEKLAVGFYHAFSGWLIFTAGFGLLYLFARTLHRFLDSL